MPNLLDTTEQLDAAVRDVKLPHLHTVLNVSSMTEIFESFFFSDLTSGPVKLLECDIVGKRYRPGKRCTVTYRVRCLHDTEPRILVAHLHRAQSKEQKQDVMKSSRAKFLPEQGMWLWKLRGDPALGSLEHFWHPEYIENMIPGTLRQELNGYVRPLQTKIYPVNYVPLRQCALCLEIGNSQAQRHTRVMAKVYADPIEGRVYDIMQQLWANQSAQMASFRVVRPLGYDATSHILWQSWSPGAGFVEFAKRRGLQYASALAARGLADLHQRSVQGLPSHSPQHDLEKLHERSRVLMKFHEVLRGKVSDMVLQLREAEVFHLPSMEVPIHGDFNHSQILFHHGKPVFLDFDASALGDPLYDLGYFIAGLHRLAVEGGFAIHDIKTAEAHFCQIYKQRVPWAISATHLRQYTALALICRRAYRALRQLEDGTIHKIQSYLDIAAEYLSTKRRANP